MDEWIFFLGAGASVASPTSLPAFPSLAESSLASVGWSQLKHEWIRDGFPSFGDPRKSVSPEVLFGILQASQSEYADVIARALNTSMANACHRVAANVMKSGGMVWTTNVDCAVEGACDFEPRRFGRTLGGGTYAASLQSNPLSGPLLSPLEPLRSAELGNLVKFHGSCEDWHTLAFTDRQLMTPLPTDESKILSSFAVGRKLVIYGYAGTDADLADLLERTIENASSVHWFEPSSESREDIRRFFPQEKIDILPHDFPNGTNTGELKSTVPYTAQAFLTFASDSGYPVRDSDMPSFTEFQSPHKHLSFNVPNIVSAQLVEKYGSSKKERRAYWCAFKLDLRRPKLGVLRHYSHWRLSRSLYNHGVVALCVRFARPANGLLYRIGAMKFADALVLRQLALLLKDGKWEKIGSLVEWSVAQREESSRAPLPANSYYLAYFKRLMLQPVEARTHAETAVAGLGDVADPERLAGALLESGAAAIYVGDFASALKRSFELQYRRGRYAIPRWQSWGGWLEAMAACHRHDTKAAIEALGRAKQRFEDEEYEGALADLETVEMLVQRVRLAQGEISVDQLPQGISALRRSPLKRGDLQLVLGEIELARDSNEGLSKAREHYQSVIDDNVNQVALAWATLGLAEVLRRECRTADAIEGFSNVFVLGRARGAVWLEAQAIIGLSYCNFERAEELWNEIQTRLPSGPMTMGDVAPGSPRMLWTITT
jgi:tetratricopeptide (TPR) repeat protein